MHEGGRRGLWLLLLALLLVPASGELQAAEPTLLARHADADQLSDSQVRRLLLHHYARWEGVPYEYGGYDRHGIDCSGFVNLTYRQVLGVEIPRTTRQLSHSGHQVSRRHLAVGDVLIFRTAYATLHVGIYVGRGQFIHASKSRGVMLSDLNSSYWSGVYVKAVRFLHNRTAA